MERAEYRHYKMQTKPLSKAEVLKKRRLVKQQKLIALAMKKTTKTTKPTKVITHNPKLTRTIEAIVAGLAALRVARADLLAIMREDAKLDDDTIQAALVKGGIRQGKAANMTAAYRRMVNGNTNEE